MGIHLLHYIYVTVYPKENLSKRDLGIFQIITTYDKFNGHHNAAEWYYAAAEWYYAAAEWYCDAAEWYYDAAEWYYDAAE